jgi:hypothetical protein
LKLANVSAMGDVPVDARHLYEQHAHRSEDRNTGVPPLARPKNARKQVSEPKTVFQRKGGEGFRTKADIRLSVAHREHGRT